MNKQKLNMRNVKSYFQHPLKMTIKNVAIMTIFETPFEYVQFSSYNSHLQYLTMDIILKIEILNVSGVLMYCKWNA